MGKDIVNKKPKKKINSRTKGKVGELELANFLTDLGFVARRGQQFSGGAGSPDVVCDSLPFHIECKRTEKSAIYDWLAQAKRDNPVKPSLVCHRKNGEQWVAILPLEQLLDYVLMRT